MRALAVLLLLVACAGATAGIETREFASEQERVRYLHFARELRCPKCQNQNLADSNAPIAQDLRDEVYRLLREGRTDQEIVDFMVQRYGDYVLYRPPFEARTVLLWVAPAAMLLGGLLVIAGLVRRSRAARAAPAAPTALSEEEKARLARLLDAGEGR